MVPGAPGRSAAEGTTSTTAPLPCILYAPNPGHLDDSPPHGRPAPPSYYPRIDAAAAFWRLPLPKWRLQHQIGVCSFALKTCHAVQIRSLCPEVGWGLSTWQVPLDVSKIK
ncbi:hypothetical protein VPH35_045108 [Triticum aestivum]|uniref:Uncharacterized protein n=1 Tax=Triticum urartu TaxID=4572 RepID=A0A8R7PTJ8_TRIUA